MWRLEIGVVIYFSVTCQTVYCAHSAVIEPWYGDYLGSLTYSQDLQISGLAYVVNSTCIQVINFTLSYRTSNPDLYFWLGTKTKLSSRGLRLPTFEYGFGKLRQYDGARVVLILPDNKEVGQFGSFGLWSASMAKSFGQVPIPVDLQPPEAQFVPGGRFISNKRNRYNLESGPVLILDTRTVKIFGFHYDGHKAPDSFFLAGRGKKPKLNMGVKVPIRGRDKPNSIQKLNEKYRKNRDLILDLPENYNIHHIDWISVYSVGFHVDFGHIQIGNISHRIPPYVPLQKIGRNGLLVEVDGGWKPIVLLGSQNRTEFTFQLGPPGGTKGYASFAGTKPNEYVWYVNGIMTPEIQLLINTTYTFYVEGGNNVDNEFFYNSLYISDDQFGGYNKLSEKERQVKIFPALQNGQTNVERFDTSEGRLCLWSQNNLRDDPDYYEDFLSYSETLNIDCAKGRTGKFSFTPDETMPKTLFYQSLQHYNMGWKIFLKYDFDGSVNDIKEDRRFVMNKRSYSAAKVESAKSSGLCVTLLCFTPLMHVFSVFFSVLQFVQL